VSALIEGRQPFPGRGLSDPDYEAPARVSERPGPPMEPDVHPAGGTWEDRQVLDVPEVDEPLKGPPMPPEPLDPGTSVAPEPEEEAE